MRSMKHEAACPDDTKVDRTVRALHVEFQEQCGRTGSPPRNGEACGIQDSHGMLAMLVANLVVPQLDGSLRASIATLLEGHERRLCELIKQTFKRSLDKVLNNASRQNSAMNSRELGDDLCIEKTLCTETISPSVNSKNHGLARGLHNIACTGASKVGQKEQVQESGKPLVKPLRGVMDLQAARNNELLMGQGGLDRTILPKAPIDKGRVHAVVDGHEEEPKVPSFQDLESLINDKLLKHSGRTSPPKHGLDMVVAEDSSLASSSECDHPITSMSSTEFVDTDRPKSECALQLTGEAAAPPFAPSSVRSPMTEATSASSPVRCPMTKGRLTPSNSQARRGRSERLPSAAIPGTHSAKYTSNSSSGTATSHSSSRTRRFKSCPASTQGGASRRAGSDVGASRYRSGPARVQAHPLPGSIQRNNGRSSSFQDELSTGCSTRSQMRNSRAGSKTKYDMWAGENYSSEASDAESVVDPCAVNAHRMNTESLAQLGHLDAVVPRICNSSQSSKTPTSRASGSRSESKCFGHSSSVVSFTSSQEVEEYRMSGYVRQIAAVTRNLVAGSPSEVNALRLAREDELVVLASGYNTPLSEPSSPRSCDPTDIDSTNGRQAVPACPTVTPVEDLIASPLWLRLCGILPLLRGTPAKRQWLGASVNWYMLMAVSTLGVMVATAQMLDTPWSETPEHNCDADSCLMLLHLSDLALALGSFIGVVSFRAILRSNLLGNSDALLVTYTRRQGVVDMWSRHCRKESVIIALVSGCSICLRVVGSLSAGWYGAVGVGMFSVMNVVFMSLTFAMLHVDCALTLLIDAYCYHFTVTPDLECSVREWNMLQAVLRKGSGAMENAFIVLQTTALVMVLLVVSDFYLHRESQTTKAPVLMSVALIAIIEWRLICKSADVTETCARVPSLINSLSFGLDLDLGRHYLVEYITYSGAGFYVRDLRLTSAIVFRLFYISVLVAFGVLTRVIS